MHQLRKGCADTRRSLAEDVNDAVCELASSCCCIPLQPLQHQQQQCPTAAGDKPDSRHRHRFCKQHCSLKNCTLISFCLKQVLFSGRKGFFFRLLSLSLSLLTMSAEAYLNRALETQSRVRAASDDQASTDLFPVCLLSSSSVVGETGRDDGERAALVVRKMIKDPIKKS